MLVFLLSTLITSNAYSTHFLFARLRGGEKAYLWNERIGRLRPSTFAGEAVIEQAKPMPPSFRVQLSARICVEASIPVALARHELGPLLLGVNDCEALKLLPRFAVEGPVDFGAICLPSSRLGLLRSVHRQPRQCQRVSSTQIPRPHSNGATNKGGPRLLPDQRIRFRSTPPRGCPSMDAQSLYHTIGVRAADVNVVARRYFRGQLNDRCKSAH